MAETYWNGEPTHCEIVRVIVGPSPVDTWWCADLKGTEREAVRVEYQGERFYIDNEDGSGWHKVTVGQGGPWTSHRSLPVEREVSHG